MSTRFSRRRFLTSTAAAAAAAAGSAALPPSLAKVLAAEEAPQTLSSLEAVEHVVFLIQENRSFDHYFGSLRGVRGFADPTAITLPTGKPVWYQPDPDPSNPDHYLLPFHVDTLNTNGAALPGTSHAWEVQHGAWANGTMSGWVVAHRAADGSTNGPFTMSYYTRADLPFHYALADAFTICDHYHCSVFGPTNPNRLYAMTGTVDPNGTNGGPVVDNSESPPYTWTTYPERLQAAGVSWKVYQQPDNYDDNALAWFKQYQQAPPTSPLYTRGMAFVPDLVEAFRSDVQNDRLPQVSWIVGPAATSEHPSYLPASGAYLTYQILEALASRPQAWKTSVVFFTYDENDGLFDHVPPPTAPQGTSGEWIPPDVLARTPNAHGIAGPIGLGFRVPMIVISPWSTGGYLNTQVADHTSMLRFLERRFGIEEPNISAWRRSTSGDLVSALRLNTPARSFPALPNPSDYLQQQYITSQDNNNPVPPPFTTPPTPQTLPRQEAGMRPTDPS